MRALIISIAAMATVIALSNFAVQFPVDVALPLPWAGAEPIALAEWLTWGAFTYPIAFLVTDLTNRALGPQDARRVVYFGFLFGVALSVWLATPRIAAASGTAFLVAQLLDVAIFDRLRRMSWWKAPLASSVLASIIDTALFFSIAFLGTGLPWVQWAFGDLGAKLTMAGALLLPFGLLRGLVPTWIAVSSGRA